MKKAFHICVSSPNEVMFRSLEDYYRGFNCLALSVYKTNTQILADAFMSNHIHCGVIADAPGPLVKSFRNGYTKYFNNKYGREGMLGEVRYFSSELNGARHILATLSYILRNGLHHGMARTPFGYSFCSANSYFRADLGKPQNQHIITTNNEIVKFLPTHSEFPARYKMGKEGVFLRESVVDVSHVELLYGTPRSFLYYMSRRSSEEWEKEQEKDDVADSAVTLSMIEEGVWQKDTQTVANQSTASQTTAARAMAKWLANERGVTEPPPLSDIDVCAKIDTVFVPKFRRKSVYSLTEGEKMDTARFLARQYGIGSKQLTRCLAIS